MAHGRWFATARSSSQRHDFRPNWKSSDAELRTGPDLLPVMPAKKKSFWRHGRKRKKEQS
jgi:hypothetical protein